MLASLVSKITVFTVSRYFIFIISGLLMFSFFDWALAFANVQDILVDENDTVIRNHVNNNSTLRTRSQRASQQPWGPAP